MTTLRVADDGGDELTVFRYNGYNFPNFDDNYIPMLSSVEIRPDDILVCAYPKSGTNWVWEMTRLLLAGKIVKDNVDKMSAMIDYLPEAAYKDLPSPRLLNSHVLFKNLPEQVKVTKPKIIYLARNPKDVLVSLYNFQKKVAQSNYNGKWENYWRPALLGKFCYGSWFDYVIDWESVKKTNLPILTLNYEDIKEESLREAKKLCKFLEIERSDEFVQHVCQQCEFNTMKQSKKSDSITGHAVFRKGAVGDWKNWFTVAQSEMFDKLYQEKMKNCSLTFRYTLDQ